MKTLCHNLQATKAEFSLFLFSTKCFSKLFNELSCKEGKGEMKSMQARIDLSSAHLSLHINKSKTNKAGR